MLVSKVFLKRIAAVLTATAVCTQLLLVASATDNIEEEPLLTVACLSDLCIGVNYDTEISEIIANIEKDITPDVMLFSGDITADVQMTSDEVEQIMKLLGDDSDSVTKNSVFAVGNEDYYAGEAEGYNSADFYDKLMAKNLGRLSDADCYTETYKGKEYILAYYYKLEGYDFFVLNPSPRDMQGNSKEYNFTYTSGTLTWLSNKMSEVDISGEQLMFLLAHFPLGDTNGLTSNGVLLPDCTNELRSICATHANLIYLYGNDSTSYETTDKRVTEYTVDGKKLVTTESVSSNIPLSSMWTLRSTKGGMQIINCATGLYLNENLEPSGEETVWHMDFIDNIAYITLSEGVGLSIDENTGVFSVGKPSPLEVYCLTTDDYTDSRLTCVEEFYDNYDHLIVGASGMMMTNTPGENAGTLKSERVSISNSRAAAVSYKQAKSGEIGFVSCYTGSLNGDNKQVLVIDLYSDRSVFKLVDPTGQSDAKEYIKYHTVLNKKKLTLSGYSEEKEKRNDFLINIGKVAAVGLGIGIVVDVAAVMLLNAKKKRRA